LSLLSFLGWNGESKIKCLSSASSSRYGKI
jgi:hypothetical protein